jgi:signal transduction histidine kinase
MAEISLRARLWIAAALWTLGLFVGGLVVSTALFLRYPSWPRLMHGTAWAHIPLFTIIAVLCLAGGVMQFRRGLGGLNRLRARLANVHEGRETRVTGEFAPEVQPLVNDLNALLDHHDRMVRRAVARAGDLAHGLKTPLAVISHEAERAGGCGQSEFSEVVEAQVHRMQRQIEYHLAQARAAASGATPGVRTLVIESVQALVRTLERLHASRGLTFAVAVPADHAFRGGREDIDEMLGNLLDNACKWARSRVGVKSEIDGSAIAITVDDDGPGLAAEMRKAVLNRGVRADEAAPGSGFGLAIVRDLAELYKGSITLDQSPLGGLQARLTLPR